MREISHALNWESKVFIFFVAVAILSVLGPFGTYDNLPWMLRVMYWALVVAGVAFFMHVPIIVCLATKSLSSLPIIIRIWIGAALGSVPGTAIVVFVTAIFLPPMMAAESIPSVVLQVFFLSAVIGPIEYMPRYLKQADAPPPPIETPLHKRLPPETTHDIVSLSMQDHYLEVTTTDDRHLVLIRFADALSEIKGLPGQRIHRSHWVAERHVTGLARDGGKPVAKLSDGRQLPISNTYLDASEARFGGIA